MRHISTKLGLTETTDKLLMGQFMEDGILLRAEQLSKMEVPQSISMQIDYMYHVQSTAVTEKQAAIYSLQRKIKSYKQQLEAKDMHLGLLQRKVTSLEEKLTDVVHKEAQWDANIDRVSIAESQPQTQSGTESALVFTGHCIDRGKKWNDKLTSFIHEF